MSIRIWYARFLITWLILYDIAILEGSYFKDLF